MMQPNFVVKLFKGFGVATGNVDMISSGNELRDADLLRGREASEQGLELPPEVEPVT
jgi:hypothetical protein